MEERKKSLKIKLGGTGHRICKEEYPRNKKETKTLRPQT